MRYSHPCQPWCFCKRHRGPIRHGETIGRRTTPEFRAHARMIARTKSRGYKVCKAWRDVERFIADIGRRPTSAHRLTRQDSRLAFAPGNARWAKRPRKRRTLIGNRSGLRTAPKQHVAHRHSDEINQLHAKIDQLQTAIKAAMQSLHDQDEIAVHSILKTALDDADDDQKRASALVLYAIAFVGTCGIVR